MVLPQLDISVHTNFSFYEINSNFILNELLKLSLVPKMDKLLHLSSLLTAALLCHVFNLSLFSGKIPQDFKTARVTPIYKDKGSQLEAANYRPISIVPTVTKIIEIFLQLI